MRKASDTMLRYPAMLPLIPAHPGMLSAAQLKQKLREQNAEFEADIRAAVRL